MRKKLEYTLPPEGMDDTEIVAFFEWNSLYSQDEAFEIMDSHDVPVDRVRELKGDDIAKAYEQWNYFNNK